MSDSDERAAGATACPSEAARALWSGDEWRRHMPAVHRIAEQLARDGLIRRTQCGAEVGPGPVTGPYRVSKPVT
jgi:hypothetical protein